MGVHLKGCIYGGGEYCAGCASDLKRLVRLWTNGRGSVELVPTELLANSSPGETKPCE
jgi:hypothetical protein